MPGSGSNRAHNYTGWRWNGTSTRLDMVFQGTAIGYINASGIFNTAGDAVTGAYADGVKLTLGTDTDWAQENRATVLNANTTLAGIIVGTPVTPAVAANSYILGGVTADGDIMLATQTGGNSHAAIWVDASAAITRFYGGAGIEQLQIGSTGPLIIDDTTLLLGTTSDIALVNRSTILGANTALTGVVVGTAVTPAVAANSLIVGNVTADGDIMLVTQTGGNSHAAMWTDASAALTKFYAGAGVEVLELKSLVATVTGQVYHGAAADGSTPGTSTAAFKVGTPPVGAATTTSKIYASATVMRKIIADGTDTAVG